MRMCVCGFVGWRAAKEGLDSLDSLESLESFQKLDCKLERDEIDGI